MKISTIVLLFAIVLIVGAAAEALRKQAKAHGPYTDWKTRTGISCCNDHDCAPATAWPGVDGNWFTRQNGVTYSVPARSVLPIPSPDGRSHACIRGGAVICLVPGEVRT